VTNLLAHQEFDLSVYQRLSDCRDGRSFHKTLRLLIRHKQRLDFVPQFFVAGTRAVKEPSTFDNGSR
jgi:hypothetical protein